MGAMSIWHWAIVLVIVLIVFGPGKLPDVFKQAGKGVKAFRDASEGKEGAPAAEDADDEEAEVRAEIRRRRAEKRKQLGKNDELDEDAVGEKKGTAKREE